MKPNLLVAFRWGLLLFLLCFIVYLGWLVAGVDRSSPPEIKQSDSAESVPEKKRQAAKIEAMDFTRSQGGAESLRVRAEDMTVFSDGVKQLLRAIIGLPSEDGQPSWQARSVRATLRDNPQGVRLEGDVVVSNGEGAELRTDVLRYDESSRIAQSEGPVHLTQGKNWCKADRLTYDLGAKLAEFDGHVHGALFDSAQNDEGRFSSQHMTWKDAEGSAVLTGQVQAYLGSWRLDAANLVILTNEKRELQSAIATGKVRLVATDDSNRMLEGERVDFLFRDGVLIRIEAHESARAQMPRKDAAPIVVEGQDIRLKIGANRGIEALEAAAAPNGKVYLSGLPGAGSATAEALLLNAVLTPEGEINHAILQEEVVLDRNGLQGFGELATWRQDAGVLELTGSPGILTPRGKAYGEKVIVHQQGETSILGEVHSVMEQDSEGSEEIPLFQGDGGPIFISSDRLDISGNGKELRYEGTPVQAKQGDSSILCEKLILSEEDKSVQAFGSVRSRIRLQKQTDESKSNGLDLSQMIDGNGDEMLYIPGLITYSGASTLRQGADWLGGDIIRLYLSEGPKEELERIISEGSAEAHFDVKHGWGDHLDYSVAGESLVLRGETAPARAEDRSRRASAAGKVLTIQLDTGILAIEPDPVGRTRTVFQSGSSSPPEASLIETKNDQ